MPRESSKCRDWEKERRNRLNEAFATLCKVLPCYDPAVTTSKIEILKNAKIYIEDLQLKVKDLMSTNESESAKVKGNEINKLHERIKRLLGKNEQLCSLLREAKISIPPGCAIIKKFKSPLQWSNRIGPEEAKIMQKKELEKENNASLKNKSLGRKLVNKPKTKINQNNTPKHRKAIVNRNENKKLKLKRKRLKTTAPPSKCVIVLSQPASISQSQCYVITNAPSSNLLANTSTAITNSGLLSNNPLVSSVTTTKSLSTIPSLGPGTLILANGTIMPVLPQQSVLPIAPQIIANPLPRPQNHQTVILLPKESVQNNGKTGTNAKTLTRIKPKYCLTRTTQVNKVPIPALTSRYANNDLVLNKSERKTIKKTSERKSAINKENGEKESASTDDLKRKLNIDEKQDEEIKKMKLGQSSKEVSNSEEQEIVHQVVPHAEEKENSSTLEKEPDTSSEKVQETETIAQNITENGEESGQQMKQQTTPTVEADPSKKDQVEDTTPQEIKHIDLNLNHSELSNDIFASLQVPTGCQNPESTSPTAAFLLAFPLVSSLTGVKVTEVTEDDNPESQRGTPTLLQIGTMDTTKPTQSQSDSFTPSLLNLDNLSFFSSKDISGFYSSLENNLTTTTTTTTVTTPTITASSVINKATKPVPEIILPSLNEPKTSSKIDYEQQKNDLVACFVENRDIISNSGMNNLSQELNNYSLKKQNPVVKSIEQQKQNCSNYMPQKSFSIQQYSNNFNDSSSAPKIPSTTTYGNVIKNYPDPLYTNSNTYSYSYHSDTNFNHQNYYKNITKNDNSRSYYSLNYENYTDYRKSDSSNHFSTPNYYTNATYPNKEKCVNNPTVKSKNSMSTSSSSKAPINWMTTPDNKIQTNTQNTEYALPKDTNNDFGHSSSTTFNSFSNTAAAAAAPTNYFNTNTMYPNNSEIVATQEPRKTLDLPIVPPVNTAATTYHHHHHQRHQDVEENQFSWSPTKLPTLLDPPHNFVSATLPTLVGDLALGNSLTFNEKNDKFHQQQQQLQQKKENNVSRGGRVKNYENTNNNHSNFLSVSQLVDHNNKESVPARATNRRNSANRSSTGAGKKVQVKTNHHRNKESVVSNKDLFKIDTKQSSPLKNPVYNNNNNISSDIFCEKNRNVSKNTNNYSAEALIGHQMGPDLNQKTSTRQNNYGNVNKTPISVPFLTDNILPYFPPVDLQPQENNYMQQNQNYQSTSSFGHNFSSSYNNTYTSNTFIPTATTITSTYLSTNNFMHDVTSSSTGHHDYTENLNLFPSTNNTIIKEKNCNKQNIIHHRSNVRDHHHQQHNLCPPVANVKKSKRKHSNESTNLPNFVDFSFLSMPPPCSISSPILPDDFHTHSGFLQPPPPPAPQLYPCKNPLYTKQNELASSSLLSIPPVPGTRSNIQHPPEISPSINTAGTSLTNFNLSTIFPEINNKSVVPDPYLEPPRIKDHSARSYTSTAQVSFNEKPSFSFSYINSTSQSYNNL